MYTNRLYYTAERATTTTRRKLELARARWDRRRRRFGVSPSCEAIRRVLSRTGSRLYSSCPCIFLRLLFPARMFHILYGLNSAVSDDRAERGLEHRRIFNFPGPDRANRMQTLRSTTLINASLSWIYNVNSNKMFGVVVAEPPVRCRSLLATTVSQSHRCKIPRVPVVTTKSCAFLAAAAAPVVSERKRRCCTV